MESIIQQELKDYELIVVNDGSDDGTREYLDSLRSNPHLKFIHQQQAGPAAARNAGIKIAQGEFVAFTDDDCIVPSNWLHQLHLAFHSSQVDIVGGGVQLAPSDNIFSEVSQETTNFIVWHLNQQNANSGFLTSNNIAYRAEVLRNAGGFDGRFRFAGGEERALNQKIISNGGRSLFVPDIVVQHYQTLTFRTFLRQQFRYGQGSYLLHRVIAKEISSPPSLIPMSVYLMLSLSFLKGNIFVGIIKLALFSLGQLAVVMGFLKQASDHLLGKNNS